jgi:hypothetical protein
VIDWSGKVIPCLVGIAAAGAALAALFLVKPTQSLHGKDLFWFIVLTIVVAAALLTLLFVLLSAALAPWRRRRKRQSQRNGLRQTESLAAGESLYSPDGQTRFTLNTDGNMVVYTEGRKDISNTGTGNLGQPRRLTLNREGWLILTDVNGHEIWKRGPGGVRLDVQDDSHVALYPTTGTPGVVWCTDQYVTAGMLALDISSGADWRWRRGEHGATTQP